MLPLDIPPLDPRAYAVLAEAGLGPNLFNPRQHRGCELVERYALGVASDICGRLGVLELLDVPRTVETVCELRGFVPSFARPLRWLLERLRVAGFVTRDGDAYRRAADVREPDLARIREEGLATDPSCAPAYELLDVAATLYPRVAHGEIQPERALFLRVSLWVAYFSNANGYYALNNRVAARAAEAHLSRDPGIVLEVGAGLGSATEALLDELRSRNRLGDLVDYRVTEPVASFRRRAERSLEAAATGLPLTFGELDLNRPWKAQGIAGGSCTLVWGVNVFHLARDLDQVLREARAALAPGGWLVVAEGVRPSDGHPVGAELPFQLLDGFHDVLLDPATRPSAGFLTADRWVASLGRAGFAQVDVLPDVYRLRQYYPGLLAAAFCARRS